MFTCHLNQSINQLIIFLHKRHQDIFFSNIMRPTVILIFKKPTLQISKPKLSKPKSVCLLICYLFFKFRYTSYISSPTFVEGDPKAPFSIATSPKCGGRALPLTLKCSTYPWSISYNAESWANRHQVPFLVFGMTRPGIEPRSHASGGGWALWRRNCRPPLA